MNSRLEDSAVVGFDSWTKKKRKILPRNSDMITRENNDSELKRKLLSNVIPR